MIMVVFMLSVRVFSCMCPDCVACIVFAGFCFLGCLFLFSFVCSVGFGRSVRLVLLVLVVLSGLFCWFWSFCPACIASLDWLCAAFGSVWSVCPRWCPACASLLFRLVVSSCFPCCAVLSCFPFRPCLFPVFFFFGVPFLPPTAGAVRPACAPCGARAFPFPLVFPYRRPRARRRMMRMPWYSPRAKRRMARTASRRPCARPARVVPAGEAGRRAGRRVSSGSGVVSGV